MPFMGSIPKNRANLLLFFDIHKYFLLKIKKDTHYCAFFLIFPVPSPSIVRHIVRFYVVLCARFLSFVYYVQILIGQTEKGSMICSPPLLLDALVFFHRFGGDGDDLFPIS